MCCTGGGEPVGGEGTGDLISLERQTLSVQIALLTVSANRTKQVALLWSFCEPECTDGQRDIPG